MDFLSPFPPARDAETVLNCGVKNRFAWEKSSLCEWQKDIKEVIFHFPSRPKRKVAPCTTKTSQLWTVNVLYDGDCSPAIFYVSSRMLPHSSLLAHKNKINIWRSLKFFLFFRFLGKAEFPIIKMPFLTANKFSNLWLRVVGEKLLCMACAFRKIMPDDMTQSRLGLKYILTSPTNWCLNNPFEIIQI